MNILTRIFGLYFPSDSILHNFIWILYSVMCIYDTLLLLIYELSYRWQLKRRRHDFIWYDIHAHSCKKQQWKIWPLLIFFVFLCQGLEFHCVVLIIYFILTQRIVEFTITFWNTFPSIFPVERVNECFLSMGFLVASRFHACSVMKRNKF